MNKSRYFVTNYIPYNPDCQIDNAKFARDLDYVLKKDKYERIMNNLSYHFENSFVTNFNIIHHESRGDKLKHSKEYYKTICSKKLNEHIKQNEQKINFVESAIDCERKDVFLNRKVVISHFNRIKLEEKLEKNQVYLSSMKKRAKLRKNRYTDNCKSLFF